MISHHIMTIQIITPIKPCPEGNTNIKKWHDLDIELQHKYARLMTKRVTNFTLDQLVRSDGESALTAIFSLMTLARIIRICQNFGSWQKFINPDTLTDLIELDKTRRISNILYPDYNPKKWVLNVTGEKNHIYDFLPTVWQDRWDSCKKIAEQHFNLDDYWMGWSGITALGSNDQNLRVIDLYPNRPGSRIGGPFFRDPKPLKRSPSRSSLPLKNYIQVGNYIFRIHHYYIRDIKELIYMGTGGFASREEVYVFPENYQSMNDPYTPEPLPDLTLCEKYIYSTNWCYKEVDIKKDFQHAKRCYMCREFFDTRTVLNTHPRICLPCSIINRDKLITTADLTGIRAYVSGGRQKIGLQVGLKLLRCGATVYISSRFPNAAWSNYMAEPDFDTWQDRLHILKCDFLRMDQVLSMIEILKKLQLHVLINNAAQTIRPSRFYIENICRLENLLTQGTHPTLTEPTNILKTGQTIIPSPSIIPAESMFVPQLCRELIPDTTCVKLNKFRDIEETYTTDSSWFQTTTELSTEEILEVNIVNQIVPLMIVNSVKPYMEKPMFIINVTAIEGQFASRKDGLHTHTNMCKAAINMMSMNMAAAGEGGVYVYVVDPGFVSGVRPDTDIDSYPLQSEDGAARILDPLIQYKNGTPLPKDWVKLKDYKPAPY